MNAFDEKILKAIGVTSTYREMVNNLKALFEAEMLDIVGEPENPDKYIAKRLSETELTMAAKAVEFHGRNALRKEQRAALKEKLGKTKEV